MYIFIFHLVFKVIRPLTICSVVHRRAMRTFWTRIGIIGPISVAFGSVLWSTNTEADHSSPYDLKLVQVLFRHGARTPLKSIPDVMEVEPLSLHLIPSMSHIYPSILTTVPSFVSSKAQWVPKLLEPPAYTHINYVVTNLNGGPKPPAPIEDSYRKMMLTVSRCVLCCCVCATTCWERIEAHCRCATTCFWCCTVFQH